MANISIIADFDDVYASIASIEKAFTDLTPFLIE